MNQMLNFADTGGLFDHFEVNREPFWPKMSWLVAGSGAWHLVLLVLILLIPPVRDAFSITAMFRDAGIFDGDRDPATDTTAATTTRCRHDDGPP